MKTVRGVLRPAFQMAVDDDLLNKNPFGFQLAGVTLNVYTHLGLEDAAAEMARLEEVESARREQEKIAGKRETTQRVFRGGCEEGTVGILPMKRSDVSRSSIL